MKKSLIVLILFVAAFALAACSADETDTLPVMEPSEQLLEDAKSSGSNGGQEEDEGAGTNTGDPGEGGSQD